MRTLSRSAAAFFAFVFASSAHANVVVDTFPSIDVSSGWAAQAQTFQTPTGNDQLLSWQFSLAGRSSSGDVTFSIVPWSGSSPSGAALYSTTVAWATSDTDPVVSGINLALTPGQLYAAVIDLQGYGGGSGVKYGFDAYSGGNSLWTADGVFWYDYSYLDGTFRAEFAPVPEPSTFIAGALLVLPFGLMGLRSLRNRKVAS